MIKSASNKKFVGSFQTENKEVLAVKMKQEKSIISQISVTKNLFQALLLLWFIGIFPFVTFSQTVEERQEYYKKLMSKGEATIKTFNSLKSSIHDLVFTDDHDGYQDRTIFQCAYELYLVDFFENLETVESEFKKMNNFRGVPEMDVLKKMNALQDRKIDFLNEGIKFYEEISTEVNSKPFKRWDVNVIDEFVNSSQFKDQYDMFNRLRIVSYEIFLLNRSRSNLAYLRCAYTYWQFLVSKEFPDLSKSNPYINYNMVNHKLAVNPSVVNTASQMNAVKVNISTDVFDYSNVSFWDYLDNSLYSSWMVPSEVKNLSIGDKELYSEEMANSSNALALAYLVSTMDFKNSRLSQLIEMSNLQIKTCTYDKTNEVLNFDELDYGDALTRVNSDVIASYLLNNKDLIKKLSELVPYVAPWFYVNAKPDLYLQNIASFDKQSFLVYEIKHDLILASTYVKSIQNDFLMLGLDDKLLKEWYNNAMETAKLKAYFQNEYMLVLNKTNASTWETDKVQLLGIVDKLRMIKLSLRTNSSDFIGKYNLLTNSNDLNSLLNQKTNAGDNAQIDAFIISQNKLEKSFLYHYNSYLKGEKTPSSLNSLGWRCLLNFEYEVAVKFLKEALKLSDNNIMITLNLAHAYLLNGDMKKAKQLYVKFPLDEISPELKLNVKTIILTDFEDFKRSGINPVVFEEIRKELGI
jgi:hypothetical protein